MRRIRGLQSRVALSVSAVCFLALSAFGADGPRAGIHVLIFFGFLFALAWGLSKAMR